MLVLEGAPKFYRGGNTRHTNAFFLGGGRAMLNALYGTAEELGIDIMYDAPVTALEIDNGMFLSATMMHDGTGHQVRARTLVAAAGGFESNIEYRISNG